MSALSITVDNNYLSHLLSGNSLNILQNTFISNIQTVLSADVQINVSRSLGKLRSVFLTLERYFEGARAIFYNKGWNNYYSPTAVATNTGITTNIEENEIVSLQLQVVRF
jgi:hypothetical protein